MRGAACAEAGEAAERPRTQLVSVNDRFSVQVNEDHILEDDHQQPQRARH